MEYIIDSLIKPKIERVGNIWKHQGFQKYLKNTGWMFFGRLISLLVSFITTIYVVRYLGPDNYGALSYAVSFVAIFSFIANLGIDHVLYRDLIKFPDKTNQYLGSAFRIKIIAGFVAILITSISTLIVTPGEFLLNLAVIIIAFSFIFQPFNIIQYFFQAKVQSKYPVLISTFVGIIINLLKIFIIVINKGVLYLSLVLLLEALLISTLLIIKYQKVSNILNWSFQKDIAKKILLDSWPFMFFGAFATVYARVDQIMIQNLIDTASVGIYDAAVRLTEVWYFIPGIIISSVFPAVVNSQDNNFQYKKRLKYLFVFMTLLPLVISFIIFTQSELVAKIVYGEEFIQSASVLSIYIWSLFGTFLGYTTLYYLLAENKKRVMFFMSFITMIVNIILNSILIPEYGILGAAWATVISYTISPFIPLILQKIER